MSITDIPSAVLRMQYRIARFPLQVIEDRLVARLGTESSARLLYERSLGTLDVTVGNALGDSELAKRGAALSERSDVRRLAAQLDLVAGEEVNQASEEFTGRRKAADQKRRRAQTAAKQAVVDAGRKADERKREAAQTVRKRIAAAKQEADQQAAERTAAVEDAKDVAHDQVKAAEQTAAKKAKAKLQDASEKRGAAELIRDEADRLEELASAEKDKRRNASP